MRVGLYARVSTQNGQQDPEIQLRELREYCAQHLRNSRSCISGSCWPFWVDTRAYNPTRMVQKPSFAKASKLHILMETKAPLF